MTTLDSTIDLLHLFGDATRVRLLALLTRQELTVAELTAITGLGQSRVSTHLGKLREGGILRDRRVGPSTFYALNDGAISAEARRVWALLEEQTRDALLDSDRERCDAVLRAREGSAVWPDALAGQMEQHYSPGRTWEATARAFVGTARLGDVIDIGAGDGTIAQLLSPRARSVTCVDRSEKMIEAARARLAHVPRLRCEVADMHELPFGAEGFDLALLFNVLTQTARPARAVAEAARVLRPGGSLVAVTLHTHGNAEISAAYQHQNAGFSAPELRRMLEDAGLSVELCELSCRERRPPFFEVLHAFAAKLPTPSTPGVPA